MIKIENLPLVHERVPWPGFVVAVAVALRSRDAFVGYCSCCSHGLACP